MKNILHASKKSSVLITYLLFIVGVPLYLYGMYFFDLRASIYGVLMISTAISFAVALAIRDDMLAVMERLISDERKRRGE